ncbi:MAG: zinc metalloprotease, partial [Bacteroidota bacterium]
MKKLLFIGLMAVAPMVTFAQGHRNCGTMHYLEQQKAQDPGLKARMENVQQRIQNFIDSGAQKTGMVVTIPVVFHVVYNTASLNISDARILAQLDVLNKDFARLNADANNTPSVFQSVASNTGIQFCMAQRDPNGSATNGIVRRSTTVTSFSTNNAVKYTAQGGSDAWNTSQYLNIWVCNLSGGVLGYAQFPGGSASSDGVVLTTGSVGGPSSPGTAVPYHLGRTATHEVGHYLDLRHIWADDGTGCTGSDGVADTPNQADENYGCPTFPQVSCSNGPNGDMFMNYMDYTDDNCMNMFTAGQSSRMNAAINTFRSGLLTSQGCVPPNQASCGTPTGLSATSITSSSATLNWAAVTGATSYNVQYRNTATGGTWTTTTSTTTSVGVSGLAA